MVEQPRRESHTPKNGRTRVNSSRKQKSRRQNQGITGIGQLMKTVPRMRTPVFKIRRAVTVSIAYNASTGLAGLGSNINLVFSLTNADVRVGGTSVAAYSLPNASEFSNLFDQYRLDAVTVRIDFLTNYDNSGPAYLLPLLYTAVDHDDATSSAATDILQFPGCTTHAFQQNGYTPFILKLSPTPLREVLGFSATSIPGNVAVAPYINTTYMDVQHYGLKAALSSLGGSFNGNIAEMKFTFYYDVSLINPK